MMDPRVGDDVEVDVPAGTLRTRDYLTLIGVPEIAPATCPFDPGYDPMTFKGHLMQSHHLMETMKISMACWQVCDEEVGAISGTPIRVR